MSVSSKWGPICSHNLIFLVITLYYMLSRYWPMMGERALSLYRREFGRNRVLGRVLAVPILQIGRWRLKKPRFGIRFLAEMVVSLCQARWLPQNTMPTSTASLPGQEVAPHGFSWPTPRPVPRPRLHARSEPRVPRLNDHSKGAPRPLN